MLGCQQKPTALNLSVFSEQVRPFAGSPPLPCVLCCKCIPSSLCSLASNPSSCKNQLKCQDCRKAILNFPGSSWEPWSTVYVCLFPTMCTLCSSDLACASRSGSAGWAVLINIAHTLGFKQRSGYVLFGENNADSLLLSSSLFLLSPTSLL